MDIRSEVETVLDRAGILADDFEATVAAVVAARARLDRLADHSKDVESELSAGVFWGIK